MFHDKCGVVGIWNSPDASHLAYAGLYALQHRGQESAGIATSDHGHLRFHKGMGKVMDVFDEDALRDKLKGPHAIGHTRYSTRGGSLAKNVQPLVSELWNGEVALAHNGQITNAAALKKDLQEKGAIFQTSSDTEILLHLLARTHPKPFLEGLQEGLIELEGAFSLVMLHQDKLMGIRDPHGFRPLCLGKRGETYILASETCALDLVEAKFEREIEPGEMVVIDSEGLQSFHPFPPEKEHFCVFELIYFSRPDSLFKGRDILGFRKALGRQLAKEAPCPEADLVISIPDSSNPAGLGFSQATSIPFELGLIRNHYIGRTFIEPTQAIRDWRGRIKYNPVKPAIEGKSIVVVDDSIVRGTTCSRLMRLLKDSGAREIHLRISSPIIYNPCYYGIDTPDYDQLIGHQLQKQEKIQEYFQADSLHYLTLEGLQKVMAEYLDLSTYCNACFSGDYPVPIHKKNIEKKIGVEL